MSGDSDKSTKQTLTYVAFAILGSLLVIVVLLGILVFSKQTGAVQPTEAAVANPTATALPEPTATMLPTTTPTVAPTNTSAPTPPVTTAPAPTTVVVTTVSPTSTTAPTATSNPGVSPTSTVTPGTISILYPLNDSKPITGTWDFSALLAGQDLKNYQMFWQVDTGNLVPMDDSLDGQPHKTASVDVSTWNWRGKGPYKVNFVAKDLKGNVLEEKSVNIYIGG